MNETDTLLPLEQYLKHKANNGGTFPARSGNFFLKYISLKNILGPIYESVDTNASFIDSNYYTHHGMSHVEDVILYVGKLLGVDDEWSIDKQNKILDNDYSVFILLVSILLHDIGMYYGREDHEKRSHRFLIENRNIFDDDQVEIKAISNIAKAHSGKFEDTKDTISNPELRIDQSHLSYTYNAKELAALVRFADEICETKQRAKKFALHSGKVFGKSLVCHTYCSYINSVKISDNSECVTIEYIVPVADITKSYEVNDKIIYMIDEIALRLDKINKERVYCNRYFSKRLQIRKIVARIDIVDSEYQILKTERLSIEDKGYPSDIVSIHTLYPFFSGTAYHKTFAEELSISPKQTTEISHLRSEPNNKNTSPAQKYGMFSKLLSLLGLSSHE